MGAMSNLKAATIVDGNSIFTEFKGALTEQYVLQQLVLRYEPYYYAKANSTQEIDFLLQDEEDEIGGESRDECQGKEPAPVCC